MSTLRSNCGFYMPWPESLLLSCSLSFSPTLLLQSWSLKVLEKVAGPLTKYLWQLYLIFKQSYQSVFFCASPLVLHQKFRSSMQRLIRSGLVSGDKIRKSLVVGPGLINLPLITSAGKRKPRGSVCPYWSRMPSGSGLNVSITYMECARLIYSSSLFYT